MTDDTSSTMVLELAAELTAAWLSNPNTKVAVGELPGAIAKIHAALSGLGSPPVGDTVAEPQFTPAVTARRSLASKDHIISMIDGKPYKMLKRHLSRNGLTPEQYRQRYGLKPDYPMVAETYAQTRRDLAKKIGLGRKAGTKVAAAKSAAKPKPAAVSKPVAAPKPATKPKAKVAAKPKAPGQAKPRASKAPSEV